MRKYKTNLIPLALVVLFLIASGAVVQAGDMPIQDEPLPPEVKKLIGMKIPAKAGDVVPGWKVIGAGMLVINSNAEKKLGYELLYQKNISIFLVDVMNGDRNRTIIDVRVLPRQLLNYTVRDEQIVFKKNANHFYMFEHNCQRGSDKSVLVVGLTRPEDDKTGYTHWSSQVRRAWVIDQGTGKISEVLPQGISCHVEID